MKKLFLFLILTAAMLVSCEKSSQPKEDAHPLEAKAKKTNHNSPSVTLSAPIVLSGSNTGATNTLTWTLPVPDSGRSYHSVYLRYRFTDATGTVRTNNGSDWQGAAGMNGAPFQNPITFTSYVHETLDIIERPNPQAPPTFEYHGPLLAGTYEYKVTTSTWLPYDYMTVALDGISNTVTIVRQ